MGRTPRLVVIAAMVGAGAGLGAVLLIESISWVADTAEAISRASAGEWVVLLILPIGVWLSWRLTAWFAPEVAGHGVPQVLAAITVRGGWIRQRVIPLKAAATALTIGSGGSAGREGSIAQIGSALGSGLARLARLPENDTVALVAAGAGAGISATFNAPIAGMFFAMEVILREISIRHLHTVVIASVSGAVVAHSILGDELTFAVPQHSFDDSRQILLYAVLGLVTVLFALLFLAALDWFEVRSIPTPDWTRPLVFGLAVAVLGFFMPEVLGTGQEFVNSLLQGGVSFGWWTLGLLAAVKAIATAATLGGRGSGGIFMPSLFIGASAGAGFARLIEPVWRFSEISPGAFGLVGMAATFSAVARAPLTSILIVFEITGDYGLVLPLMVATIVSTPLAARLRPESAYTSSLARRGIHPVRAGITDLLETITVGETVGVAPVTVEADASVAEARRTIASNHVRGLPVVSGAHLIGIVTATDISDQDDGRTVKDVMSPDPVTVSPSTTVAEALERMAALGIGRLPIVADEDGRGLVGVFSRDDVVSAYHLALSMHRRRRSERTRPAVGDTETGFFDIEVPPDSVIDGRMVQDVRWPAGCIVVAVHRGSEVIVPVGKTTIVAGDSITLFGPRTASIEIPTLVSPDH